MIDKEQFCQRCYWRDANSLRRGLTLVIDYTGQSHSATSSPDVADISVIRSEVDVLNLLVGVFVLLFSARISILVNNLIWVAIRTLNRLQIGLSLVTPLNQIIFCFLYAQRPYKSLAFARDIYLHKLGGALLLACGGLSNWNCASRIRLIQAWDNLLTCSLNRRQL